MIRTIAILIPLLLLTINCEARKETAYWIDANVRVLGYVGKIGSRDWVPEVFHTYEVQQLKRVPNPDPVWGCRSFYLPGLVVKGVSGERLVIPFDGWIVVKKRHLRTTYWKLKESMKYKTKGNIP
jgi:hypothetical protein